MSIRSHSKLFQCTLKWKFSEFYEILQILGYTWNAFPLGYQD